MIKFSINIARVAGLINLYCCLGSPRSYCDQEEQEIAMNQPEPEYTVMTTTEINKNLF